MSDRRFLVFGATGYTGRHVVQHACTNGIPVVAHMRPGSPRGASVGERLAAMGAALAEVAWTEGAIQDLVERTAPTHVFALLGITKAGARREAERTGQLPTYAQVDSGYSQWIIQACTHQPRAPRVVYLSSLGADRPRGNAYLRARHDVEMELKQSALPYTIVRPGFISGSDRDEQRPLERVGSVASDLMLGLLGGLGAKQTWARYASVSGADLGRMVVSAAVHAPFSRRVVDMVDLRSLETVGAT